MMPPRKFGLGLFVIVAAMLLFSCGGGNSSPPPPPPPPPPALAITTTSLPAAYEGKPYNQTLQATGGSPPYTWSVNTGYTMPAGLSMSASGVISGTSTWTGSPNTSSPAVTVSDSVGHSASATISITLIGLLRMSTTTLWPGNIAVSYSQQLFPTGGSPPYTMSLNEGSLPPGLSLASGGMVSGTPTAFGDFNFSVLVKDSDTPAQSLSATFKLTITNNVVITNSNSLPATAANKPYSVTFAAAGGTQPYTWSLDQNSITPAGLTLDAATGIYSGTPTASGFFYFRVQVSDASQPAQTAWKDFSLSVIPPLAFTTASPLPDGPQWRSYMANIWSAGGVMPHSLEITSGTLPPGITSTSYSGNLSLSGYPTTLGVYTFDVKVTDSESPPTSVTKTYTLRINPALVVPNLTALPDLLVGQPLSFQFSAAGGLPPLTWQYHSGPPWVSLDAASGLLNGTATAAYDWFVIVSVSDSSVPPQTAYTSPRLHVADMLKIATSGLPTFVANVPLTLQLALTGGTGPFIWSVSSGALPAGLTLDYFGAIKGTPTATGSSTFTVAVSDPGPPVQSATRDLTLATNAAPGRNDTIATATPLSNGRYSATISPFADPPDGTPAPDMDVYKLTANPGATVTVEIFAQRLTPSSPLDSVIELVDENGNRLQACDTYNGPGAAYNLPCLNDDLGSGTVDSRLYFQVPASASGPLTFYVRVLDWRGDARPDFAYQISISGAN